MRAAIYARKSNEQKGREDEQKSVPNQIKGARAFIESRGWTHDEQHEYEDDGFSGVLFEGRPGYQRMMAAAEAGAFDALVLFDLDRFGRDSIKNVHAWQVLSERYGVAIWDYSSGQQVDLTTMGGRFMLYSKGEISQEYRETVRKHTTAAMFRKAQRGEVTGGIVFGYTNERRGGSDGPVHRVINELEAAVIREIFQRKAEGEGNRTIAAALNAKHAPTPKPRKRTDRSTGKVTMPIPGWSASSVRDILHRPLYRGIIVYGKSTALYGREVAEHLMAQGKPRQKFKEKAQLPTDPKKWVTLPVNESLRIVDPELAARVDAVATDRRTRYLRSLGAPGSRMPERAAGTYLLTGGMLVCPTCKGHFEAVRYPRAEYVCATRRRKPGACPNTLRLPIEYADNVVLDMVVGEVLGRSYIEELLAVVGHVEQDNTGHLMKERDRLRGEIERLVDLAAQGIVSDSIGSRIKEREAQIARLEVKLAQPRQVAPDIDKLREALTQRAAEWRETLRSEEKGVKVARLLLRRLIGPLELVDESQNPNFVEALTEKKPALLDGLADGAVQGSSDGLQATGKVASPAGFDASQCLRLAGVSDIKAA